MSRYIDADKVLEKINKICNRCGKMNKNNGAMCGACYFDDAKDMIDDFPTAEVKPIVYGEWKFANKEEVGELEKFNYKVCSICGYGYPIQWFLDAKFCPNCGAKMKGSE